MGIDKAYKYSRRSVNIRIRWGQESRISRSKFKDLVLWQVMAQGAIEMRKSLNTWILAVSSGLDQRNIVG